MSSDNAAYCKHADDVRIRMETNHVPGKFQFRLKRGADGSLYAECGLDWECNLDFGHPQPGVHDWIIDAQTCCLQQTKPNEIIEHYKIVLNDRIKKKLLDGNSL